MMAAISEDDAPVGNRIVVRLEGRVVDPYVTEIQRLMSQEVRLLNCSTFLNELLKPTPL